MIVKYCANLLSKIYYSLTINIRNMKAMIIEKCYSEYLEYEFFAYKCKLLLKVLLILKHYLHLVIQD